MRIDVRCCCDPAVVLGTIEVDPSTVTATSRHWTFEIGASSFLSLEVAIWAGVELRLDDQSGAVLERREGGVALKGDDLPLEVLRRIPGWRDADPPADPDPWRPGWRADAPDDWRPAEAVCCPSCGQSFGRFRETNAENVCADAWHQTNTARVGLDGNFLGLACAREVVRHADDSAAYLEVPCTCGRCV